MNKKGKRLISAILALVLCTTGLQSGLLALAAENETQNGAEAQILAGPSAQSTVADWKFGQDYTTGDLADGSLIVQDQSGNGNDLELEVYNGGFDRLSFSTDDMDNSGSGSMVFDGDNASKTGATFITKTDAAINSNNFQDGYTIEYIYYFPEDWTDADRWMTLMGRSGSRGGNPEGEQGTMYTAISNCKEIQYITGNAAGNHAMTSAAWSVSMDQGGVWYHIAITSDGQAIRTYVNGCEAFRDYVSEDMVGMYADPEDGRFRVGASWWNGLDKFLQGSLQEIRISEGALPQENWLIPEPTQYAGEFGRNEQYTLKHDDNYNIVLLPDTQNTVKFKPEVMDTAIKELIRSADELNVAGVVSMGDIVENNNDPAQYETAREVFYQLPDAGIKFLAQPGNHDGSSGGAANYGNSFGENSTLWRNRTAWYSNEHGYSSYMLVDAGSYTYLVISLASAGSASGSSNNTSWDSSHEQWLKDVLAQYPNCPAIVTTHDLQNCSETEPSAIKLSGNGTKLWNIVQNYDQVFMLVGGHSHGAGTQVLENASGKPVLSILTDYQFAYNGGNGWFRYLEFDETDNKIYYSSYSPYAASLDAVDKTFFDVNFLSGDGNEGALDLNFEERFPGMSKAEPETQTEGKWMTGEYHTHTGQSKDATEPFMSLNNVLGAAFRDEATLEANQNSATQTDNIISGAGFDYLMLADHLRKSYNGVDGSAKAYDTPFYVAVQTQQREIDKLLAQGKYSDKLLYSGFEWDMPGLDHAAVAIMDDSGTVPFNAIHEFEWKYASISDGDETSLFLDNGSAEQAQWGSRMGKGNGGTTADSSTALAAVEWLADNYPDSFVLLNHPSRHAGELTIDTLRKLNDVTNEAGESLVFGFEGMPGNQMDPACELPASAIRAGADEMISVTGGVWDALLSEGRRFYNFANSDFHFKVSSNEQYSSGYWASEFSRNYTWVEPGDDNMFSFSDVVEGMRSGNSYSVNGELISDLDFQVTSNGGSATMGGELSTAQGSPVTVTIRFKVPAQNNYESLYGTNTEMAVDNRPALDHVDLISGTVTGKVSQDEYGSAANTDAAIVKSFDKADLAAALGSDGYYTLTYQTTADSARYFRLRGTSTSQVDANGDPLTHERAITSEKPARFDYINDYNYSHLSFYANPIFLSLKETPAQGYENSFSTLDMAQVGRYDAGMTDADGGVMEIVTYNAITHYAYAVNGKTGTLAAISLEDLKNTGTVANLSGKEIDVKTLVNVAGFTYGDMTSVAISPDGKILAAAIQAEDYDMAGRVALFTCGSDGTLTFQKAVETGVQPDMVTFTPDGKTILTADEGEPRKGYGADAVDPKGSVTVITAATGAATVVTFDDGTFTQAYCKKNGVLLGKVDGTVNKASVDLEPEYITVSDNKAYISLQENNAVAVLDLARKTFTGIYGLGYQDFSQVRLALDKGAGKETELATYENLLGVRMPDGISSFSAGGITYLLTANEGDSRDWEGYNNELEVKKGNATAPNGSSYNLTGKVTYVNPDHYEGLDSTKNYLFGGRSFSIFQVSDNGLNLVYDSQGAFESDTLKYLPDYFNCSNDDLTKGDRNGKKGPEPETVITGTVDGRTYAFITLERIGGIMVYDVTNPAKTSFVNYINSRDFSAAVGADDSPEGLAFISADSSSTGNALLLAACEVGGTVAAYELIGKDYVAPLNVAVISDCHVYDGDELGKTGAAFQAYLMGDRKMLVESTFILSEAIDRILESNADYVLIPGDLTKDGETLNHTALARELSRLEAAGKQVFIINGNHDLSNAHAVSFDGESTSAVSTVDRAAFQATYAAFGYDQAVAKDPNSLSYAADLGDSYRLIAMDACIYNNDPANPQQKTAGKFQESTLRWVLNQIEAAIKSGKRPIGMMHHGLVAHTDIQPTFFPEYLVADYETVARQLANAGMNLVFTGHFHSQDAATYTDPVTGKNLVDIETGSLVTYPSPIRYVALSRENVNSTVSVSYESTFIDSVAGLTADYLSDAALSDIFAANGFTYYAYAYLMKGLEGQVPGMLAAAMQTQFPTMDPASLAALATRLSGTEIPNSGGMTLGRFLATCMSLHYTGDENQNPAHSALMAIVTALNGDTPLLTIQGVEPSTVITLQKLLGSVAYALITDTNSTPDNAGVVTLAALPTYSSGSGSSGSGSSGTTTEKNPDGSTTVTKTDKATGTVTQTTTYPDGVKVESKTASTGAISATVTLPAGKGSATVTIPLKESPGISTVAVIVNADGSREVIKTSLSADWGLTVTLSKSATLEIIDNHKKFSDVAANHWASESVDFVTSRELFSGVGSGSFAPQTAMSRAMLITVLARLEGADLSGGATWYEKAVSWAKSAGISDGSAPEETMTREQLAVMLYRYEGSPAVSGTLGAFSDETGASAWAREALIWTVEHGILTGKEGGILDAQGPATRAEVATIFMRYMTK